jgi:NAD(P)-dependent dehydrogenase (short-subunit alcohol dehydrogenase family)
METNYYGPLLLSRAFAPVLAKNGGGAIVNMLSVLSWVAVPSAVTYSFQGSRVVFDELATDCFAEARYTGRGCAPRSGRH